MKDLELCVCLKSVPDPRQPVESWLDPQTGIVKRRADELAVPRVISPLDRHALEEALRIKEMLSGRVTVISMDTEAACDVLKETLALGADQAILLSDRTFAGADTLATARTLGAAIRSLEQYDLIICGSWSYHGNTGQVGPQLAEILGIAHVSFVTHLEFVNQSRLRLRSEWEDHFVVVEAELPLLITVTEAINEPRHASLMGILRAREKQLLRWGLKEVGLSVQKVGLSGSPSRVVGVSSLKSQRKGDILGGESEEAVNKLIQKLHELSVL